MQNHLRPLVFALATVGMAVLSSLAVEARETTPPSTAKALEPSRIEALEHVTLFVRDQDEALAWYVERLGLVKVEDQRYGANERWLTVAPPGTAGTRIVLAVPREALKSSIGQQHNWVFRTGDCRETEQRLVARGVKYLQAPSQVPWGCQAVIEDLYGNRIVLLGRLPAKEPT